MLLIPNVTFGPEFVNGSCVLQDATAGLRLFRVAVVLILILVFARIAIIFVVFFLFVFVVGLFSEMDTGQRAIIKVRPRGYEIGFAHTPWYADNGF